MKKTISIKGMSCGHCQRRVQNALSELQGVESVTVDLATGKAFAILDQSVGDEHIRRAVEEAGYEVEAITSE